jgi:hypothetical protein
MSDMFITSRPVVSKRTFASDRRSAARVAADWLCLAATPAFALMALLTSIHGASMPDMLCSAALDASPLSGMVPMYLLMSALHLEPWLRLLSRRGSRAGRF